MPWLGLAELLIPAPLGLSWPQAARLGSVIAAVPPAVGAHDAGRRGQGLRRDGHATAARRVASTTLH